MDKSKNFQVFDDETKQLQFATLALHGGYEPDPTTRSCAVPLYQTASYTFKDADHAARLFNLEELGNIYTRIMNPTTDVLEKRISLLEGGAAALATASGQSAEALSILNIAEAGDEIISSSSLYGGTFTLFQYTLKKMGIGVTFVDQKDPRNFLKAITSKTKLIYVESVGNPGMDVADIEAISEIAHSEGIPVVVDNTFPTPYLMQPFKHGADVIVHSATKYLGGHGTSIGGLVVDSGKFAWNQGRHSTLTEPDPSYHGLVFWDAFRNFAPMGNHNVAYIMKMRLQWLRDLGPTISPFNAWLFLQGIETLSLRMERHSQNAMKVAEFLESHKKVSWVRYPGLSSHPDYTIAKKYFSRGLYGGMMGFAIKGGLEDGKRFINSLRVFSHLANVGDAKSLAVHPASTTHSQLTQEEKRASGATDNFIRISVGIEAYEDLEQDLKQALDHL